MVIRRRVEDQSPTMIGLAFVAGVILGVLIGANSIGRQVYLPPKRNGKRR
jgi:UDP-N-acetylmuramyl pentapeptide phosphotransferase/UDP-N-acetylglucosamine-1-phosphate transferase